MANISNTSITKTQAANFVKNAQPGQQLNCEKIKGFYLLKTQKNATWQFRYTDFAGKRRKLSLGKFIDGSKDRTDAVETVFEYKSKLSKGDDPAAEIQNKKAAMRAGELTKTTRTGITYLNGSYALHQGRKKDGGKHTLQMISRAFPELLEKPMDEITKADIHQWQSDYANSRKDKNTGEIRPLSYDTIVRTYGAFKTMVKHAYTNGIIETNPLAEIHLLEITDQEKEKLHSKEHSKRRILTETELQKLNYGINSYRKQLIDGRENSRRHGKPHLPSLQDLPYPNWFFPFFRLAAYTGMRPGDLYNLQWHQLNINFGRLIKVPNKTRHHKNPAKLDIPLNEDIKMVMRKWKEQIKPGSESDLVFPSPVTGKELSRDAHNKHWNNVLKHAELEPQLDFYALRHHYISKLVVSGVPLFTVARLAGHKSVKMIEEHYGHLSPHIAADALETISNDFKMSYGTER